MMKDELHCSSDFYFTLCVCVCVHVCACVHVCVHVHVQESPELLPYLKQTSPFTFDIHLEVGVQSKCPGHLVR